MTFKDRKYQDGDQVIWNTRYNPDSGNGVNSDFDRDAVVISLYTSAGRGKDGDYAYNILYGPDLTKNTVWGYQLRLGMFKYDPKQAGDTDEDV